MEENLYKTDLVDFEILQRMQNLFTKMTGIEALVSFVQSLDREG